MNASDPVSKILVRDHIAIQILCAAIINPGTTCPWIDQEFLPRVSYELADKVIEASKKKKV
jgi:hypothetical protein